MRCANGKCDNEDRFRVTTLQYGSYDTCEDTHGDDTISILARGGTEGDVLPIEVECLVCGYKGTPATMGMEVPLRILELTEAELHFGSDLTPPLPFPEQQVCAYVMRQNARMQAELERLGLPWSLLYMSADLIEDQEQGEESYVITMRLTETRLS